MLLFACLALFMHASAFPIAHHTSRAIKSDFPLSASPYPTNPTTGCSQPSTWQFSASGHKNLTLGDRSLLVHIPKDYDPSMAHALVVSFHAFKMNGAEQERISGFSEPGLRLNGKGIVAVYPNGQFGPGKTGNESIRAWQGAPYAAKGVDDIAFTQQMIEALSGNLCLDSNRFYASGKSNGGGLTNLLACTPATANLFAAFAPVSAALYAGANPADCSPGRPIPLVNFHGLADRVVPFDGQLADREGNTEYATPNISQYRAAWAERNGCAAHKAAVIVTGSSSNPPPGARLGLNALVSHPHVNTTLKQSICAVGYTPAIVQGFTVKDLGHSWPSTLGLDGGVTDFNATTANILPFFDAHALGSNENTAASI
ncbi:unnamed protein product [Mycena citricolor]|uniref:feruloyl esterase n=1 Tax=Mycena citricolor TaxID=2018698 RepID=A0AAD2HP54_9AGAR|nr:unnamed protein product [Mycena citricolor]